MLGHNAYAYCLNNPINRSDSSGCRPSFIKPELICKPLKRILNTGDFLLNFPTNDIRGNIKVKGKNQAQFLLEDCIDSVKKLVDIWGIKRTSQIIAECVLNAYEQEYDEKFFANAHELTYETSEHIEGYLWSVGDREHKCPIIFALYYSIFARDKGELDLKAYVYRKCKSIEYCKNSLGENIWYYGLH